MVGSLLYLTSSRPHIVFSVGLCARFQANPKESHLTVVKRILRYLKGTTDLYLWYPKCSNFNLVGYVDYACFLVDRKSTSEFCATDKQITDIFTKALSRENFERNRLELGMIKIT
ncbi:secreted RxLR effector protein 161-like [Nicotiana sylvestris]|uniref:secreted RxLR effector protein 161-like n=1 Tax=Nicotiana sylvestris TaxID=4096 RepID=UPI00388C5385